MLSIYCNMNSNQIMFCGIRQNALNESQIHAYILSLMFIFTDVNASASTLQQEKKAN